MSTLVATTTLHSSERNRRTMKADAERVMVRVVEWIREGMKLAGVEDADDYDPKVRVERIDRSTVLVTAIRMSGDTLATALYALSDEVELWGCIDGTSYTFGVSGHGEADPVFDHRGLTPSQRERARG